MKIAVVGNKYFQHKALLAGVLDRYKNIEEIVTDGETGAGEMTVAYAKKHNIPCKIFKPNRALYRGKAGVMNNRELVNRVTLLIAFWDGSENVVEHCIALAKKAQIGVEVINC